MFLQKTICKTVQIKGIGLHTGQEAELAFSPAPPYTGIHFIRSDLLGKPRIPVQAKYITATERATTLGRKIVSRGMREVDEAKRVSEVNRTDRTGGTNGTDRKIDGTKSFSISTVEHCLSAVTALRIDNLFIDLKGPEIPIGDGSAKIFLEALLQAKVVEQEQPRQYIFIQKAIHYGTEESHAYVLPYNGLRVSATIEFPHPVIQRQHLDLDVSEETFTREIAEARTFGFLKDIERLRSKDLILGGSLDNALVLDHEKVLSPEGLRFKDEFVRHKILDALGDLATLNSPLLGHLVLYKAGHNTLHKLIQKILSSSESYQAIELGGPPPLLDKIHTEGKNPFATTA